MLMHSHKTSSRGTGRGGPCPDGLSSWTLEACSHGTPFLNTAVVAIASQPALRQDEVGGSE